MKKITRLCLVFVFTAIFVLAGASTFVFAQSDATRRLYVATAGGFSLNEAAGKAALAAGADINWQNPAMGGETMLIMAIKGYKEPSMIKFLMDNGADPGIADNSGKNALDWAHQYNLDRNRNGREILALLGADSGQKTPVVTTTRSGASSPTTTAGRGTVVSGARRTGGAPSDDEIVETLERSFTNAYQNHFFGVKNTVTFEWSGAITVGAAEMKGRIPKRCFPARLNVKVTMQDPRDGNRSSVSRGVDAMIGGYRKTEIFCFSKDGFGAWAYVTYEP